MAARDAWLLCNTATRDLNILIQVRVFPIEKQCVRDSHHHFLCDNDTVAKTSPQNLGDLIFLESQKGLAIIIQNNYV